MSWKVNHHQERSMEGILPQRPQKEPTLLILRFQTSDIQNHEKTNLYRLQPPNFWYLVTEALGNEHLPSLRCGDSLLWSFSSQPFLILVGSLTCFRPLTVSFSRVSPKPFLFFTLCILLSPSHLPQFSYYPIC